MTDTRVCVVAGVGPGVGAAVARRFAREGFAVALMARRADALDGIAAGIEADGGKAWAFPVDLSDPAALDAAFGAVRDRMGRPRCWSTTPAVGSRRPPWPSPPPIWN